MVLVTKKKPAPTIHDKRRQGKHHRTDHGYHTTYWPYLPIALIVVAGVVFSGFLGNAHKDVLGYATDMSISGLLAGTNNQRSSNGLGALAINAQLNQAAQAKANDMVSRDYWSHNTPEGNPPWVFFTNAGYQYQTAGENLAYGFNTYDDAITGWMNSPGHRANILNTSYLEVGFGVANSANYQGTGPETVVVAMYGSQVAGAQAAAPAPSQSTPVASKPTPSPATPTPAAQGTPAPTEETPAPATEENVPVPATNVATKQDDTKEVAASNVSRIQLMAKGSAPWSMFAVSALATVAIALFVLRHGLFWHRALVKGERFFIKHKLLDIALVATAVLGFVLTRSAGVIH